MKSAKTLIRLMNLTIFGAVLLIVVNLLRATPGPSPFDFDFTWLSAIYLVAIVVAAVLLLILGRRSSGNRTVFWFMMYVIAIAAFMFANALKAASGDQATYIFWYHLLDFTGIIISPIFLMFVLAYIDRQDLLHRPITWLALFGSTFFILPLTSGSTILSDPSRAVHHFYGFPSSAYAGPGQLGSTLWSTVILLTGMILLIQHYNQVKAIASQRKQARLFVIATIVPLGIGFIDVGILPLFGIDIPLDPLFSIFQIALIGYALFHYKLFTIDPTALTDTILATVDESVVTINTHKEIEYINEAAQNLLGVSLKTIRGRHISSIFDHETSQTILQRLKPEVTSTSIELTLLRDGHKLPISLATSKIISRGTIDGYILVFRDISKEQSIKRDIEHQVVERTHQLNDEHARLQAAMDSLGIGLLITFKDGNTVSYNTVLPVILLGKSHEHGPQKKLTLEVLGQKLQVAQFDLIQAIDGCQSTGKSFEAKELTYGNQVLRVSGTPIGRHSSSAIGVVVLVEDITEAKIQERSKDEFFSIASHELRTPLTSIKGNTSMILQYYPEALKDSSLREMIDDIHTSSVRLIEVVNDFLDVSRLEQSRISFNYEPVHIEEVMESVTYEMSAVLKEKKLYLKIDKLTLNSLPQVWVDKNRLKQVIYNLVGNAAKFTEAGGITISARLEAHEDFVKVLVIDTGRGMTAQSQQLLFRKFQQASSSILTRDTTRGTGLGLYISKMIVENMGGSIKLESSIENEGTTFSFTVPVATAERVAGAVAAGGVTDAGSSLSTTTKTPPI